MKLSNLFKKAAKKNTTSVIQKLENTQLEKVIGGIDIISDSGISSERGFKQATSNTTQG